MADTIAQNILVPTDFSTASMLAVEAAAVLAKQNHAACTLMHVFDPTALATRGTGYSYEQADGSLTLEQETEDLIHEQLRRVADEKLGGIDTVNTVLVLNRSAATGICDYARKEGVDLIVISTHGRSGLSRFLIGSVAERVVRHAPCPVLTLRSKLE